MSWHEKNIYYRHLRPGLDLVDGHLGVHLGRGEDLVLDPDGKVLVVDVLADDLDAVLEKVLLQGPRVDVDAPLGVPVNLGPVPWGKRE